MGKYTIPLWFIALIVASSLGSVIAYQVWTTVNVQVEIKEPIQILSYPHQLSLYPGETKEFDITLNNQSPKTYYVILNFSLKNTDGDPDPFGSPSASFSNQTFIVVPGQAKVKVSETASETTPAGNYTLTISFSRIESPPLSSSTPTVTPTSTPIPTFSPTSASTQNPTSKPSANP